MAQIGKINILKIVKIKEHGIYLDAGNSGKILLPRKYVPKEVGINDNLEVFVYRDSEDRIIATTEQPYAMVGEGAFLKVISLTPIGAFLDWGLPKDLFVPFGEQKEKMREGKSYIVFIYIDKYTRRILASSKLDKFLDREPVKFKNGQEVDLLIADKTDLGYKAIINNLHWGVLYQNEVFQNIKKGQHVRGFIKKVRDDDKIDLCLSKSGYKKIDGISNNILEILKEHNGFIAVTDKSSPEVIYSLFGISKKVYKKAIGSLYKRRIVSINSDGIALVQNKE